MQPIFSIAAASVKAIFSHPSKTTAVVVHDGGKVSVEVENPEPVVDAGTDTAAVVDQG